MKTQIIRWGRYALGICLYVAISAFLTCAFSLAPDIQAACPENVTQGTNYGNWTNTGGWCPSASTSSVTPSILCAEIGQAPTIPTVVLTYTNGQKTRTISYNCPNPGAPTSETSPISAYSVGTVFWDPPLPAVVTNSFSSWAYALVTATDSSVCPYSNYVAIGVAGWIVSCNFSFYTTNCAPSFLAFTNLSVTTNGCPNSGFSASASHHTTNGIQIIAANYTNSCGNLDTNCPASKVTNSISPTIVTNWWTISGVGSTPPSGTGLSASFTPTNGGNGTITFYTEWKNGCATNITQASSSTNFHVGDCPCTTPIPDAEWTPLKAAFPKLERCHTCKLGPATGVYNCIAWAAGITSTWYNPNDAAIDTDLNGQGSSAEMTVFLNAAGVPAGSVTYYGYTAGNLRHAARNGGGSGPDCSATSKLGSGILISHKLEELEGTTYGSIVGGN